MAEIIFTITTIYDLIKSLSMFIIMIVSLMVYTYNSSTSGLIGHTGILHSLFIMILFIYYLLLFHFMFYFVFISFVLYLFQANGSKYAQK